MNLRRAPAASRVFLLLAILVCGMAPAASAQISRGARSQNANRLNFGRPEDAPIYNWYIDPAFKNDVFTFARLKYDESYYGRWTTDTPFADLNLTMRLHRITSMKIQTGLHYVDFTAETLRHYPLVYMVEPGELNFSSQQAALLRDYLLKGGFLMLDDFWGDNEWANCYRSIKRVFPDRKVEELTLEHPIFHCVFDLRKKPQMPGVDNFLSTGLTWEYRPYNRETHDSHFFGIFDDKGRMMVFISHNNDFGDGWEQEGADSEYFHRFSEPQAYPMIVNILFYAMSH